MNLGKNINLGESRNKLKLDNNFIIKTCFYYYNYYYYNYYYYNYYYYYYNYSYYNYYRNYWMEYKI